MKITAAKQQTFYKALCAKDSAYEGVFWAGITTTGIFCRPTCTARKPKFENCTFYTNPQQALLAGFRPCKRCQPLSHPREASPVIQKLVAAVEANPEKRWSDADFRRIGADASTARRQFKKRFGMTFVAYARARRMGLALKDIKTGGKVIDAQLNAGYGSASGFRDAFTRIMGTTPGKQPKKVLKADWIDTPLGPMMAMADDDELYLLEFVDRRGLEREVERMRKRLGAAIVPGACGPIKHITRELKQYFAGALTAFETPLHLLGSPFQQKVWNALRKIPYGATRSYAALAKGVGHPAAVRAAGSANGANQLAIIIPCHRVITSSGDLGGYAGGLVRKKWLLEHERRLAE